MKKCLQPFLLKLFLFLFILTGIIGRSQTTPEWNPNLTPGGANSIMLKFTKQVWLNPTIIIAKQRFEEETHVKLLLLPRLSGSDTSSNKLEKAFDKVLSLLAYKENTEGSIKFYFDPKNTGKPFSFGTSEELWCKFTRLQIDTVEQLLNKPLASSSNLDNFAALPFDSIVSKTSRYCKTVLLSHSGSCGPNPENNFKLSQLNCVPARLNFEKVEQPQLFTNGGVDEQKYPSLAHYYNSVIDLSDKSNYPVAWKAVAANKNDVIRIKIIKKEKDFNFSRLLFKNASGTETYNTGFDKSDSTIITLSILGKPSGSMLEVVGNYTNATGQSYAIGAFNIFFYEPKQLTLNVWDVNGAEINTKKIEEELNKIYNHVFISWKVEQVCGNIQLPGSIKKNIHVEKSGLLSNYMGDMKPIINYFKDNCSGYASKAADTYYMVLGCTNDGGLSGYMPRARSMGFAFNSDPHTIAHELGHGAFGLKHIFSSDELGEGYRYQTDNLMDYSDGTTTITQNNLYKHQWDLVHDPDFVGWFEGDDEEAQAKTLQGKSIAILSDTTMTEGKVFIYNGISKKIKVKFETSDTSKAKIVYQLVTVVESSGKTINYPKTGYDTLIYNQVKEITLDSIPQGKYMLTFKSGKTEYKRMFHIRRKKLEITSTQLESIYPNVDATRAKEIVEAINKYSELFGITTTERMAHFLGQIGAETGSQLNKLKEDTNYNARGIVTTFGYPKYGHLFEESVLNKKDYSYSYSAINYEEGKCITDAMSRGTAVFNYDDENDIARAYADEKKDTTVVLNGKPTQVQIYKYRTDVTNKSLTTKVKDNSYNSGRLRVKEKYIKSAILFDVTYACRMGNGNVLSKEGSRYAGMGYIHLTGKDKYVGKKSISAQKEWKDTYPNIDLATQAGMDKLVTDVEVAIFASMVYWKMNDINEKADVGTSSSDIKAVTKSVNGGEKGLSTREINTDNAFKVLKK